MGLRDTLIEWRQRRGFSQGDLGEKLGFSTSGFSRIERGERGLEVDTAERWAEECGLRIVVISPETDELLAKFMRLAPDDLEICGLLLHVVEKLDASDRRTLRLLLSSWRRIYASTPSPHK